MLESINHIGIAVKNLEESVELFKKIFQFDKIHIEVVEAQKVKVASFKVGDVLLELTSPTNDESTVAKFIEKKGEGIHHIAFNTNDIKTDLKNLEKNGVKLINPEPQPGAHNMQIAFLHPKSTNGVLMEICQTETI